MSKELAAPEAPVESAPAPRTDIPLAYAGPSQALSRDNETRIDLRGNLHGDPVALSAIVRHPLRLREALSALHTVIGSDYRYVPRDRSKYLAYLALRRETANLNAWQTQQAYHAWQQRNDPDAPGLLDPLLTVHPDRVLCEVFSKDESTYAQLSLSRAGLEIAGEPVLGTTQFDFTRTLFEDLQQLRNYRPTTLHIGAKPSSEEGSQSPFLEKVVHVPDSWLRALLQIQTAATLPHEVFPLAPLDLYNVLHQLRFHADRKGERRGLRVELVPGEAPVLVLEPWEAVVKATGGPYTGRVARVVRVWGRRRLSLIQRLLPLIERAEVHILGSGLPSFWVFHASEFTFTLGLTGFTAANWTQAVSFDLQVPRASAAGPGLEKVQERLQKVWKEDAAGLAKATGLSGAEFTKAVQAGCRQGTLLYDLAEEVYRWRPVTRTRLPLDRLEYRHARERVGYDLVSRRGAVKITSKNPLPGRGLELTGDVNVSEDKRNYRPQLLLDPEGRVNKADCTCHFFRQHGLKEGPCEHLLALLVRHHRDEAELRDSGQARQTLVLETRTYSKRRPRGEEVQQITLDRRQVRLKFGTAGLPLRQQNLRFNSEAEARANYFSRVTALESAGYLDASADPFAS